MNTNSVTASGSTNGAIFMPIAASIWSRSWTVIASQNSCTPPGTPVEVTLARRKNASPITITAAIAVAQHRVGVDGQPEPRGRRSWWPTSIAASARIVSVIAVVASLRVRCPCGSPGPDLLHHRQRGARSPAAPGTGPCRTPRRGPAAGEMNAIVSPITVITNRRVAEFSAILRLSGCASAVIDFHRPLHQHGVEQTQPEADAEEDADHHVAEQSGGQRRQAGRARHRLRAGATA